MAEITINGVKFTNIPNKRTGVKIGNKFGNKFGSKAELIGGIILIIIGIKILLEHLGIIIF